MAATPSGWLTPTGQILTARMNVLAGLLWPRIFAGLGVPGLSWTTAYVRGDNIKTAETSNGKEHEWFNPVQYRCKNGMAKDLKLRLRYSVLRVSSNASDYNVSGNEVRFYVEYPFDVF